LIIYLIEGKNMAAAIRSSKLVVATLLALLSLAGCNLEVENSPFDSTGSKESSSTSTDSGTALRSVSLYWSAPIQRVNGENIAFEELGGYEIRYRKGPDESYTRIVIDDPLVEQYHIDDLPGDDYQFEVAAFDTTGLYSNFVTAER
jgi:hypothetical protein